MIDESNDMPPASRRSTTVIPGFARFADNLAAELERLGNEGGNLLAAEGRRLAAKIRRWDMSPPSEEERVATLEGPGGLADFERQARRMLNETY
jgi:hypothetical protein